MKEHLLAFAFLCLMFLIYMAPMPESFLNIDYEPFETVEEEHLNTKHRTNPELPEPNDKNANDTIRTSVVAATRL